MEDKIVAKNRKTGGKYIYAKLTETGLFYEVSTKKGWPQTWLIDAGNVILVDSA